MAAGAEILGVVYFAAVKFAGYTAAASFLKSRYRRPDVNAWVAGGVRTAIGLAVGLVAVFFASQLEIFRSTPAFFVLDIPAILSAFVLPGGMWIC